MHRQLIPTLVVATSSLHCGLPCSTRSINFDKSGSLAVHCLIYVAVTGDTSSDSIKAIVSGGMGIFPGETDNGKQLRKSAVV